MHVKCAPSDKDMAISKKKTKKPVLQKCFTEKTKVQRKRPGDKRSAEKLVGITQTLWNVDS